MPVIQTAFSVVVNFIGVISFMFLATFLYLMYTDPTALNSFVIHTEVLIDSTISFVQNVDIDIHY